MMSEQASETSGLRALPWVAVVALIALGLLSMFLRNSAPPAGHAVASLALASTRAESEHASLDAAQSHVNDATTEPALNAEHCQTEPGSVSAYQQLDALQWRELHRWQAERGLSLTVLQTDNSLKQQPSAYQHYSAAQLQALAEQGDANAMHFYAERLQKSDAPTATYHGQPEDRRLLTQQLWRQAAVQGHVPAMLAIADWYRQASEDFSQPEVQRQQTSVQWLAWRYLADWRLGLLPQRLSVSAEIHEQALLSLQQHQQWLQQQRQQLGLLPLDNQVPAAIVQLMIPRQSRC
ncbi:hypothetical protein [Permianibacter aggregans]|uniref:Uncharacterized protein n=1 Tax=Permianibacter aggregans TaxID=1510150 RepID=A0A4R6ULF5_9GAMM|nr:hypothetical protein [Permianibacter aggregans]QGX40217.1 hypothetical protein E2H98_11260 [Permianibacter aggregans]TDQ47472.1 hypothetical protein EV696_11064 [Permianibacter aggregans]